MKSWAVQDAKAHFSQLLDLCLKEGPQMVTKRGLEAAVLVPAADWHQAQATRPTLKQLLLAPGARGDLDVPQRGRLSRRSPHETD